MGGTSLWALIGLGLVLGLRHGIDWDHIAAITDITGSVVTTEEAGGTMVATRSGVMTASFGRFYQGQKWHEARAGLILASMYAFGHALVVTILGILAIWAGAILPAWVDPIMERIVGTTLLILGFWIFFSIIRYGRSFRLQSRWMLVFSLVAKGWHALTSKLTGTHHEHSHDMTQYGNKTAFSIGLIHGIGAETGSQALLLAGAAGATTPQTGSLMLLSFVIGLLFSNSLVAGFSLAGFVSSSTKRNVYLIIGIFAGLFSLMVGAFFVTGRGANLPDLQQLLDFFFGSVRGGR